MSRRPRDFGWFPSGPKKPPPAHGIKVKKAGATWWGQRWIEALERMSAGYASRLGRGRTYARAGRTHDLVVTAGKVTAKVTGSRPKPYLVTMTMPALSDAQWKKSIASMAEKAQFSAALLAGEMPKEIDEAFRAAGVSLFPTSTRDLATSCTCPDWANPCKHVAAAHYVLGEALDRDPFLLFELRGRTKAEVLDALRAARGATGDAERASVATVTLEGLSEESYDALRAPLPALGLSFDEPRAHAAALSSIGAPPAWSRPAPPAEVLGPSIRAAAERARRIALAEPTEPAAEPDASPAAAKRPKKKVRTQSEPAETAKKKTARKRAKRGTTKAPAAKKKRG